MENNDRPAAEPKLPPNEEAEYHVELQLESDRDGVRGADLSIRKLQKIQAGELNVLIKTAAHIQRALGCSWEKLMP